MSTDGSGGKKNNINTSSDNGYYSSDDLLHPISFIEVQSNECKRIWLKVISFFVAFIFLFQQIGVADMYRHKRLGGVAEKLLSSSQEYEQSGRFAPSYLKRQQSKHEEIIRQKTGKEALVGQLGRRKPEEEYEAPMPLKRKRGGGGGGGAADYTLTQPDDEEWPHEYNDLQQEGDVLEKIDTFDITRYPVIDVNYWKQGAEKKEDEKSGLDYWVGFEGKDGPKEERKIKEVIYFGDSENEKIKYMLSGYVETPDALVEKYKPKFRTEYQYEGDSISKTLKYYVEGQIDRTKGGVLVEEAFFEGTEDDNRIVRKIEYDKDTASAISYQEFIYDEEGEVKKQALREVRSYDTRNKDYDADGDGDSDDVDKDGTIEEPVLTNVTYFVGEKDKEIADYTITKSDEGNTSSTIINYYRGGKRAAEADWRDPKERVVTYQGEVDIDAVEASSDDDGNGIPDKDQDKVISISFYHAEHRLPGEEVLDYTLSYIKGKVSRATVYFYGEDETRATGANYRWPMSKSVVYWGEGIDENGNIKEDARARSATFFYIEGRLKGEEVQDYTVSYLTDGVTVKDTTVYFYEEDNRASESDVDDRMKRTITYWGEAANGDGSIKDDAKKKSETIFQFMSLAQRGEEVSDVTFNYYRDGETVRDTTVYFYEGNLRASKATNKKGMERSATYWGNAFEEVPLVAEDGSYDLDGVKEYLWDKFNIDWTPALTKEGLQNSLLDKASGGDGELIKFILDLKEGDVFNAEEMAKTLLSVFNNDNSIISLLLAVDLAGLTSRDDLIAALLIKAGLDAGMADMATILLTMDLAAFTSTDSFLKSFISAAKSKGLSQDLIEFLVLSAIFSDRDVKDLLADLTGLASGNLKTFLEGLDLDAEGITTAAELIQHLKDNAAANGYTEDDVMTLVAILAVSGKDLEGLLSSLTNMAEGNLKAFLEGLDLDAEGITTVAELIQYLKDNALAEGYTEDDVMSLLLLLAADGEEVQGLFDALMAVLSGGDGTISGLIATLLATDMGGLESANDLLNALIITAGGAATGELKTLLEELKKTNPIGDYTTASKLLGDLTSVVDAQAREANQTGIDLIAQLRDRLDNGDLDDASLLAALNSLAGGEGPAELVKLLLTSNMNEELMQSLLDVFTGGDVDLLNLLIEVDMTGVNTAEEFLEALVNVNSDDDYNDGDPANDVPDLLEILLGTDPSDNTSYPETFTYRYEVKSDAKLKSQT
ncbi:MAG: hypothetical protein ABID83_05600, partial [Candidatus Omnitrophota bacterium]